ncbi:hypothetical protein CCR94_05410 [Rhodoblastus sphagnicola]|uniref:DUF466 domain-containing protein n=1 Tax=Rhodoblastus sphagnicola TaxID=333368 RepID=A0A2S6NCS0_9HYPH|nr:YbdD/YjiX family protein [Rhodoblastus sphagnicola]MBB4196261.1 uncharacterized short protein YbdD (DUF466 family) [Rhodoblastus sphagnicola]PPQ32406.1 hypothetical protein CCR94_05410 [Rhodoblastus sphagnicola]
MPVCCPPRLKAIGKSLRQTAALMCGQPDYDAYVAHVARTHPGQPAMSRTEFFRNREDRRFGVGNASGFRCC